MTFVPFLHFSDILDFAKKTKKNTYRVTKTYRCHKTQKCDIVTFGNVTKCHTFSNFWYKGTSTFYVCISLGTTLTR